MVGVVVDEEFVGAVVDGEAFVGVEVVVVVAA